MILPLVTGKYKSRRLHHLQILEQPPDIRKYSKSASATPRIAIAIISVRTCHTTHFLFFLKREGKIAFAYPKRKRIRFYTWYLALSGKNLHNTSTSMKKHCSRLHKTITHYWQMHLESSLFDKREHMQQPISHLLHLWVIFEYRQSCTTYSRLEAANYENTVWTTMEE